MSIQKPPMTKERKLLLALSVTILVALFFCTYMGWHRSPHSNSWHLASLALFAANFFLTNRASKDRAVPDTLTSLFPKPTTQPQERP